MAPKRSSEKMQYAPLAQYLRGVGCDEQNIWCVGQGRVLRLLVTDPSSRTPDVVGAQRGTDGWRTHIIEAKRHGGGAAAIPLGIAHLRAVRRYADFLYLSMDQADWDSQPDALTASAYASCRLDNRIVATLVSLRVYAGFCTVLHDELTQKRPQ